MLDEIDAKILEILKKDARTPFTKVGSLLGISDATIHQRLKKLKDEGVLLGYTVEINEELLGKKAYGLAQINVNPGHLDEVISKLIINNRIRKIYETHGENNLIALLKVNTLDELRDVIVEIRQIKNISSTELIPIFKTWK